MDVNEFIKELDELNIELEEKLNRLSDIEMAREGNDKVKEVNNEKIKKNEVVELYNSIDTLISKIEKKQQKIELEIVKRSLEKDDKAKEFVDSKKDELKNQIENGKKEIEEYEQFEEKTNENAELEKVNNLIKEKKDLDDGIGKLLVEKTKISYDIKTLEDEINELEQLEDINKQLLEEIEELEEKLKDDSLSDSERASIQDQIKDKENTVKQNEGKMSNKDIVIKSLKQDLESKKLEKKNIQDSIKNKENRIKDIDKELTKLGIDITDKNKVDQVYNENEAKIYDNNKVIENVKKTLNIEPEKADDVDYIKEKAKNEIEKRMSQIEKLEEREKTLDEASFSKQIEDSIKQEYKEKTPESIEDIITAVVMERRNKEREEKLRAKTERSTGSETTEKGEKGAETEGTEKGDGSGVGGNSSVKYSKSGIPVITSLTPAPVQKEVGFFRSLKENFLSIEYYKKRNEFVKIMYPELSDKERKKYINEHTDKLNFLIRNGTSIDDVKEGVRIEKEVRQERLNKIRNNTFLDKLKVNLGDKDALEKAVDEYAKEKAKQLGYEAKEGEVATSEIKTPTVKDIMADMEKYKGEDGKYDTDKAAHDLLKKLGINVKNNEDHDDR